MVQSESENSILKNSGVDEHSHTGVLSDSVRDKVCSRCIPCLFPPNHCRPHLAGHTGVSRRALLGQESGWGFTKVTPQHLP